MATTFCPVGKWGWRFKGLRFVRPVSQAIGQGHHRSGWPAALEALQPLANPAGILFEDFAEQRFCYAPRPTPIREPWVGVFHHPWDRSPLMADRERPSRYFDGRAFRASAPFLRLAICLSEHAAAEYRKRLRCPVVVIKHPTDITAERWDPRRYLERPRLVQAGWYLRNTRAIFQVTAPAGVERIRLWATNAPWLAEWDHKVKAWHATTGRVDVATRADVAELHRRTPEEYDALLASAVVLAEYLDASASNVVVECIARATPLVVNRHPAIVEYLGPDYPGYFDDPADVAQLCTRANVVAMHRYLAAGQVDQFTFGAWAAAVASAVATVTTEAPA